MCTADIPTCDVSTMSGEYGVNGSRTGALLGSSFQLPFGAVVTASGAVIVSDETACSLRLLNTTTGVSSLLAGGVAIGFGDGSGSTAMFNSPQGLALSVANPDVVYVCDSGNNAIRTVHISTGVCSVFVCARVCVCVCD